MPKNKTGLKLKASVLALGLLSAPLIANAAGVGKLTVLSALGQPLKAEIELSATKDELNSLVAKLGTPDQFRQQGIEFSSALVTVNLSVEKRANGQTYVKMTSERPINDPFLDVLVELSWASGRLLREYTFLLDPPELSGKKPAPAPVAVPEVKVSGPGVQSAPVRSEAAIAEASKPAEPAKAEATKPEAKPDSAKSESIKAKKSASPKVAEKSEPAPVAESAPAPVSKDGQMHTVRKGDTLGKIAAEYAYEGVSLDQMLVAIFNSNKDAFVGDNMNRLKSGKIVAIPSKEEAASLTAGEARKTVAVHSANFEAYRTKLAAGAETAPAQAAADQSSSGKIAPKVEDKAPAAKAGTDTVVISKTELGKATKSGKGADEDKIAAERALKEEKARVAELEKNVAELKRLTEAQNKTLAEAEKRNSTQKAAAEKAAADKAAAEKAAAEKAAAEKLAAEKAAADKAAADKAAADKAAADKAAADKAAEPKPAEVVAPAPVEVKAPEAAPKAEDAPPPPRKKPVMPPPPPPEPTFMEENGPLVFGAGGVLALLLGFLGIKQLKRRREMTEASSQFGEPSGLSSVFGSSGGQSVDTRNISIGDNFSQSSLNAGDNTAGVDPVAEAEVYMAYGRDAQAEEILLEAMKHEPNRHAIHLKLLELYAARRSTRPFEEVAKDLMQQTGGSGADWDKAVALGKSIDPENPLYGGQGAPVAPAVSTGAFDAAAFGTSTVIMPPGQLAKMAAAEPPVSTLQFDQPPAVEAVPQDVASSTMVMDAPPAIEMPPAAEAAALDFDLDLGGNDAPVVADAPAVLDFDLDLGAGEAAEAAASEEISLDLNVDSPSVSPSLPEINFDLELPSIQPEAPVEAAAVAAPSMDFDFNLDAPAASPVPEASAGLPDVDLGSADFGGIDLSLDAPAPAMDDASSDVGSLDADENPEVATKLELAQAYEEMGDKEGMRELLQEVLAEGTSAQQEVARNKLAQHGLS